MGFIEDLAAKIAQFEGFNTHGSVAARNNNPGNLRAGPGAVGTDARGYAIYPTAEAGWSDLYRQIDLYAGRGLSLQQMINLYAPPSENATSTYIDFLSSTLGIDPSLPLAQYVDTGPPTDFQPPATSPPASPGSTSPEEPAD